MDLKSLKSALEPLNQFGQDEFSFEVEGTHVTLRPLLPKEEVECSQRASEILKQAAEEEEIMADDDLPRAIALSYFDQFRIEVISYALVQINETDFRGVKTIETGDVTESGAKIRKALHLALRDIMAESWSRAMITICFAKYGDLVTRLAEKADRVAGESMADLEAEINRVESRLADLQEERDNRARGDSSVTALQIRSLVEAGVSLENELQDTLDQSRADRRLAQDLAADESEEEEEEEPTPEPAPEEVEGEPRPPRRPVVPPRATPPTAPPPQFRSSFEELESPDSQAIEQDRIRAAQAAAAQASREELASGDVSRAQPAGTVQGKDGKPIPAYRMPPATLSDRGKKRDKKQGKDIDPDPRRGTRNPNFKPSGG